MAEFVIKVEDALIETPFGVVKGDNWVRTMARNYEDARLSALVAERYSRYADHKYHNHLKHKVKHDCVAHADHDQN